MPTPIDEERWAAAPTVTHKTFCRICSAFCALEVEVANGRIEKVRGDASDPIHGGYCCQKGRQVAHQLDGPERVRGAYRRRPDGAFEAIPLATALDEIAEKLDATLALHGPRSVATYCGTASFFNGGTHEVVKGWLAGLGSPGYYTSLTIDQPAKLVATIRHGVWGAGGHAFADADVALAVGINPIVSQLSLPGGVPGINPVKRLNEELKRGLRLIVVDPRQTELAKRAELHLQIRPGEDATLLAGLVRTILEEDLFDRAFCSANIEGVDVLRDAVARFGPDYVEQRSGVPREQMLEAARLFARGPRGSASSGTGPDMANHPNLTEHLLLSLNSLCGRMLREGEPIPNPGTLGPPLPKPAQAVPREFYPRQLTLGGDDPPRIRGLQQIFGEMPTAALADEILLAGDGQIRALVSTGGNAVAAWPDQAKTIRALESLDLHVVVEAQWSDSARLADYVLPARLPLEREDVTNFADPFYEKPYAFHTNPIVEPDFEVIEDWQVFVELAKRMETPIVMGQGELDPQHPPSKGELLDRLMAGSRVPLDEIRAKPGGHVFDEIQEVATAPFDTIDARLNVAPEGIAEELAALRAEPMPIPGRYGDDGRYTHLLISRRMRHVMNSVGQGWPGSEQRGTTNPAFVCRSDCERLGFGAGDLVVIESERSSIEAVIEPVDDLQPGVVSMSHAWGRNADHGPDVRKVGANTGRLIATDAHYDPITGMVRMSAIPVRLSRPNAR